MTYRNRRLAKADRYRDWAGKRDSKATTAYNTASTMAEAIPFGQPVLAGHNSESRDRRYRDRIGANMDRAGEHGRKAEIFRGRADSIEAATGAAIYADDPDAIEALTAKIAGLEAQRAGIKAYNASCRRGRPDLTLLDERHRSGLTSAARAGQVRDNLAMPGYVLANLGGVISAARKRLATLS
jgi:Domain of unknown function (DUF3560)